MEKNSSIFIFIIGVVILFIVVILLVVGLGLYNLSFGLPIIPDGGLSCSGATSFDVQHDAYASNQVSITVVNTTENALNNFVIYTSGDASGQYTMEVLKPYDSSVFNFGGDFSEPYTITVVLDYTSSEGVEKYETATCTGI